MWSGAHIGSKSSPKLVEAITLRSIAKKLNQKTNIFDIVENLDFLGKCQLPIKFEATIYRPKTVGARAKMTCSFRKWEQEDPIGNWKIFVQYNFVST